MVAASSEEIHTPAEQRPSPYLNQERVPLVLALDGLDRHILSFPDGLEDDSEGPSANSLEKDTMMRLRAGAAAVKAELHHYLLSDFCPRDNCVCS